MYIAYKVRKNVPKKAIANSGDISYVCSIGGALASRFGTELTYTGNKDDALKMDKTKAKRIATKYGLEVERF